MFESCTIKAVDGATAAIDGSYNLGRPWQNEPRATYLNTTMNVLPTAAGWTGMNKLTTHFGEYGSKNGTGASVDLSGRTVTTEISVNAYAPVLSAEQAANFTLKNVLGGTDSWLPTDYTTVLAAPTISLNENTISWSAVADARCYVIFKNGEYYANQTGTSYSLTEADEGIYTVRAANEMGGLGAVSTSIVFKRSIAAGKWSTIVVPFDIASEDITTVFGNETSVAELKSGDASTLTFNTTLTDNKMKANQPYAIKVANNLSAVKLNNVTTDYAAEPTQTVNDWNFVGTYSSTTVPEGSYYFKENELWKAGGSGTTSIKPFRAYLHYTGSAPAPAPTFTIDGEVTGIAHISADGQMNLEETISYPGL